MAVLYKKVSGFPGYWVGDDGSVWSNLRPISKRLKPQGVGSRKQYLQVNLRSKQRYVHRLVLRAFVGPCPKGMEACHNDGNSLNNSASNLRWGTRQDNVDDMVRHGVMQRGTRHWNAKLDDKTVLSIRSDRVSGAILRALSAKYHLSMATISRVVNREAWNHV